MFLVRLRDQDHPLRLMSFKSNPWLKFDDPENEDDLELNESQDAIKSILVSDKSMEEEEKKVADEAFAFAAIEGKYFNKIESLDNISDICNKDIFMFTSCIEEHVPDLLKNP